MRPSILKVNQDGLQQRKISGDLTDQGSIKRDFTPGISIQEHFEAKNTGVGTEELEQLQTTNLERNQARGSALSELNVEQLTKLAQLYPDIPIANLSAAALSQAGEERLRVSIFHQNPEGRQNEASSQLALKSPASSDFSASRLGPRREEEPTSDDRRKEIELVSFAHYLATLDEPQKYELYKHQLQQAMTYQQWLAESTTPNFQSPNKVEKRAGSRASSNLAGQLLPRIIINNALGPNKIVYIDPFYGKSQDLQRQRLERQGGIEVVGESVTVLKGTGPGSAMGIPVSSKHTARVSPRAETSDHIVNVQQNNRKSNSRRAQSLLSQKRNRQLYCDTVVMNAAKPQMTQNQRYAHDAYLEKNSGLDLPQQTSQSPPPLAGLQGMGDEGSLPFTVQQISFRKPSQGETYWPATQIADGQDHGTSNAAFASSHIFTSGPVIQRELVDENVIWVQKTHDGIVLSQGQQHGLHLVGENGDSAPGLMGNPVYVSRPGSKEPSQVSGGADELGVVNISKNLLETPDPTRINPNGNIYTAHRGAQMSQNSQLYGNASGYDQNSATNQALSRTTEPLLTGATGGSAGQDLQQALFQDSVTAPTQFKIIATAQNLTGTQSVEYNEHKLKFQRQDFDINGIGSDIQIQSRRSSRPQQQPHPLNMREPDSSQTFKMQKTAHTPGRDLPRIDKIVEEATAGEHAVSSDALSTSGQDKRQEETARVLEPRHAFENPSTKTASPDFSQFSLSNAPILHKALLQQHEPLPTEQYSYLRPLMQQLMSPTQTQAPKLSRIAQNPPMPFPGRPRAQITNSNSQFSRTLNKAYSPSQQEHEPQFQMTTGQSEDLQELIDADKIITPRGVRTFSRAFERPANTRYYYINQELEEQHLQKFRKSIPSAQADLYPETKQKKFGNPKMAGNYSSLGRKDASQNSNLLDPLKNQSDKIQMLQRNSKIIDPSAADPGTARLGNSNSVIEEALPGDPKYQSLEKTHNSNYLHRKEKSQFKLSSNNHPTLKSEDASASAFKVFKQSKKNKKDQDNAKDEKKAFILVKNQPNAMYGTRMLSGRGSKGLLSKISGEIKTAINQQNSKSQSKISQVVIQKWSAYDSKSQPAASPKTTPKETIRREVIASRQNQASNPIKQTKDKNALSSFCSEEEIKSSDITQNPNRNGNNLVQLQKSDDISKENVRVNTMFVQEDSSELAIEQAHSVQQNKTQVKNSKQRTIDKSDRITDEKGTEKTETNAIGGSSLMDQIKQRSPSPNFDIEDNRAIDSTTENFADKSKKGLGLIDYNQGELPTPIGTINTREQADRLDQGQDQLNFQQVVQNTNNIMTMQGVIVSDSQILETFQPLSRMEMVPRANQSQKPQLMISSEDQDKLEQMQTQNLEHLGSPNRFELPKPSVLGDLKSIYNPNFHIKRQMKFYSHKQSDLKQEKRHNQFYTQAIQHLTDEKSFYPKTPMASKPIFNNTFQRNLDLNMGHLKQMNQYNKDLSATMKQITQKSDKISDLARRKSKFTGLDSRNFSSDVALAQSFDNRDTSTFQKSTNTQYFTSYDNLKSSNMLMKKRQTMVGLVRPDILDNTTPNFGLLQSSGVNERASPGAMADNQRSFGSSLGPMTNQRQASQQEKRDGYYKKLLKKNQNFMERRCQSRKVKRGRVLLEKSDVRTSNGMIIQN